MKKEAVNKFDLEAAFKALNEVEIPVVKGIRPNRENLQEKFTKKLVSEILVEDYFDVSDAGELEQAQEEREAEIAKAKLARIEKIVDLDAETEEDLLPSYVGKFIIQCPQCMTLFYKKEEDIEKSEENPDVVNLNEPCQHCGNSSGYTLVGKVDQVGEDEAEQYDAEDFEEDELNLDFDETEEPAEDTEEPAEETSEESTEEEAATEGEEEDLAPIEEPAEEEEEVKESLTEAANDTVETHLNELLANIDEDLLFEPSAFAVIKCHTAKPQQQVIRWAKSTGKKVFFINGVTDSDNLSVPADTDILIIDGYENAHPHTQGKLLNLIMAEDKRLNILIIFDSEEIEDSVINKATFVYTEPVNESLKEDVDLNKQLDLYNDFIKYLQKMVEQDEDALEEAKKLGNKEVIAAIEKRLENSKAELKAALPTTVKDEVSADELPTPEEADMEDAAENKDEEVKAEETTEKKESLTEDFDAEAKLDAEEAALKKTNVEEVVIEAANSDVVRALDNLEAELTEDVKITEANFDVSDADFRAMLKNPVFNEGCKKELEEDLPPVNDAAFERATDAIEAAGSELTPEEQRLEDEELAAKENVEDSVDTLEEDAPQGEFVSQLKRNYSITELIAKDLKKHPLFSSLSTRTIQRVLLPYYIENMGRENLSTQAVIDFFEFEGFAPYVFDNFMTMDPVVRKELLKADAKFMEIFNEYAKTYDSFPGADELDVGETKFSYAFDVIFYIGAQRAGLTERMVKDFSIMYANGKFDKKLCDATIEEIRGFSAEDMPESGAWESVEDFDENSFNKLTEQYLTEVYSNVKSFETTSCSLDEGKLVIEGKINFSSGKSKNTAFVYEAKEATNKNVVLEGLNADFATEKAFVLSCKVDTAKCLIVESLNYKYSINNTLVEGLLK